MYFLTLQTFIHNGFTEAVGSLVHDYNIPLLDKIVIIITWNLIVPGLEIKTT